MNSSKIQILVDRLMSLLEQPELLFLIAIGLPLILYASRSPKYRWWVVAFWVFFLPIGLLHDWKGNWMRPPFPFDKLVFHGRHIALFTLVAMLPAAMKFRSMSRPVKIPPVLLGLLAMNLVYCLRYLPTEHLGIALTRLGTYVLVFYFLALSVPRWLTDRREVWRYLSAGAIATVIFVAASIACYIISPASVALHGRLSGLTSNPNFMGSLCGYSFPALLGLSLSPSQSRKRQLFWMFAAAFVFLALLWSGSRTSMGMCAIAVLVIFRAKLGRILLVGVPLVLFVWLLSLVFEDAQSGAQRMTSLSNTRMEGWTRVFESWKENLILGNTELGMNTVENSYLALAANTGVAGCLTILVFLILVAKFGLRLLSVRPVDREEEVMRDVALAGIAAALGHSVFEASLLASLGTAAFWIYLYFTLAGFVLNSAATQHYWEWYRAVQAQPQFGSASYSLGVPPNR